MTNSTETVVSMFNAKMRKIAPRPLKASDTGLSFHFLENLIAKHLYHASILDIGELSIRTALNGSIVNEILSKMRADGYIEVRSIQNTGSVLRYGLTDKGRTLASTALMENGYIGPAPVPLSQYSNVVKLQSVHKHRITKDKMEDAFKNVVIPNNVLGEIGPAMHSGRSIFVYGLPGTGKTYISQKLATLLGDPVLIPHAIYVEDSVVQVFDPAVHRKIEKTNQAPSLVLSDSHDPRFVFCERPAVITGGELTLDMLEVSYDNATKLQQAPLQLKATNGLYLIDDLGRQRASIADLLNRWIIPMENKQDYLTLSSGKRFPVEFDVILIFSTNINPYEIADDAFLRRLGHKIHFSPLGEYEYAQIWRQECQTLDIPFDVDLVRYTIDNLHKAKNMPMLPCHPRDLLRMALDYSLYRDDGEPIDASLMDIVWHNYFVSFEEDNT